MDLLLQHGADPLLTDDQGFNLLHSATFDGNVFQLVLLLHQDIQVDMPDPQGHTALMWACYKGYPAVIDLFLRWGANVYARDDQGFTALHWALVKGSLHGIQSLIEYGSDRFAENNEGKTPTMVAKEMNSLRQWRRALAICNYNPDGSPKALPFPLSMIKDRRWFLNRFFFLWPAFILMCSLWILAHIVVYAAVPLSLVVGYGLQYVAIYTLRWAPSDMKNIHKTVSTPIYEIQNGMKFDCMDSPSWPVYSLAHYFLLVFAGSQPCYLVRCTPRPKHQNVPNRI